jgi:hypothetical protein
MIDQQHAKYAERGNRDRDGQWAAQRPYRVMMVHGTA